MAPLPIEGIEHVGNEIERVAEAAGQHVANEAHVDDQAIGQWPLGDCPDVVAGARLGPEWRHGN
jgi:hypothetical protein